MNKIVLFVVCCALAFACMPKKETVNRNTLTENKFVLDSLLKYDSEQELIAEFGKEMIVRDTSWYPEGMGQYIETVLYPNTKNEVRFVWKDSASFSQLQYLSVVRDSSDWSTRGVKVGTRLTDLVALNGTDFTFSGFGWDYGGSVAWEPGGNLVGLQLELCPSDYQDIDGDSLIGDVNISSRSTVAKKNNPRVCEIILPKGDTQYD
jgi:hypothetical protein